MNTREMTIEERAELIVDILQNAANYRSDEKPLAEAIAGQLKRQHRTLQAGSIRIVRDVLNQYAETPTDLRNEGAVKFAKRVSEIDDCPIPFI